MALETDEAERRDVERDLRALPGFGVWWAWVEAHLERLCDRRRWRTAATLVILAAALFASFPALDTIDKDLWTPVLRVAEQPFHDLGYDDGSHESKLLYRVTVPLIGGTLGFGIAGYLALQVLFGVLLIVAMLTVLERLTSDRVTAFLFTLAACMTYGGVTSFLELRGIFDGVALALLVAALAWPRRALIFVFVFLACWTDERSIFASVFLLAFFAYERSATGTADGRPDDRAADALRSAAAVVGAVVAYGLCRLVVAHYRELPQPVGGLGPRVFLDQINNWPVGIWTGLEGLWIVVVAGLWLLWRNSLRTPALLLAMGTAATTVFAGAVVDITRSMAYLLPAVVVCVAVVVDVYGTHITRRVAVMCLVPSMIWPIYYVGGTSRIWLLYPLPLQIVRWVTQAA